MIKIASGIFTALLASIGIFNDTNDFLPNIKSYIYPEYQYEYLLNNIDYKVQYKYLKSDKEILKNGNDMYKYFLTESNKKKMSMKEKKVYFEKVMVGYYERNPKINLEEIQKNIDVNILNYGNFKNHTSLKKAFIYFRDKSKDNAKLSFLKFIYN